MTVENKVSKNSFNKLFLLGLFIIILDQITKFFARKYLETPVYINNFFSFDLSFNRGISWGIFYSHNPLFFYAISMTIALILLAFSYYIYNRFIAGYNIIPELLVFFGGISNLIDRFFYEGVVDFLAFNFKGFHFPNFNIADIFITAGVFFIFGQIIFEDN